MNNEEVRNLLDKARQSLNAAEFLFEQDFNDFAASRAYYAIFYSIEALLLTQNLSFSKHSTVISAFGKHFIKTGIFDKRYHQYAIDAFDMRNIGDYGAMYSVNKEKAKELLQNSKMTIEAIESYLES